MGVPAYLDQGWDGVIPLRPDGKIPYLKDVTGRDGRQVTAEDSLRIANRLPYRKGNLALRLPKGIIGIDVDEYMVGYDEEGQEVWKHGYTTTILELTEKLGPLPFGPYSTSRGPGVSGIWLFHLPGEYRELKDVAGADVEIIQWHHRYTQTWPSVHPRTGATYQWYAADGTPLERPPRPEELPTLPQAWADYLKPQERVSRPSAPPVDPRTGEILEGFQGTPEGLRRRVDALLREIRDEPEIGGRGEQLINDVALELGRFIPHQLQETDVVRGITEAVDTWTTWPDGGREKVLKGIETGLPDGMADRKVWEERRTRRVAPRTSDQFEDSYLAASVVADVLTGTYRYVPGVEWKAWTGRVWRDCDELEVAEQVRQWAVQQYQGALDQERREPSSVPMDVITGWRRALRAEKQVTVLKMARGFEGVFTTPEELDRDPDKLNAQNGVVNLITGELLPHDPDLLMTKIAGAEYRPGYRHPDWDKALEAVPEKTREWLQVREGQAVTGYRPPDGVLVVSQGSGENGKTTRSETIMRTLGDYSTLLSDRVLMADPSAHPTELMDLMGVRYAVMEETPEARRLDTQRLKRTVGTPEITARRMRENSVTFTATHSMFISTNFRPEITETDHGSWRRVALAVYPYRFRKPGEAMVTPYDRPGDPGLQYRCETDPDIHAAALAWLVEGAQRWYAADRVMPPLPERVKADTLNWRKELDVVLSFSADVLIFEPGHHIHGRDFKDELDAYLIGKGMNTWSERTVAARFESHEAMKEHGVEYKPLRTNPRRSRSQRQHQAADANPYLTIPGGATYKAWTGVRFRTVADDADEWVETADQDHVHDVHDSPVTPQEEAFHGGNGGSVNIVNIPGQSDPVSPNESAPRARAHVRELRPGRPYVPPGRNDPPPAA